MSSTLIKAINSGALTRLAQAVAVALSATLVGCQTSSTLEPDAATHHVPNLAAGIKQKPVFLTHKPSPLAPPQDVWERMRQGFQLQQGNDMNPRIEQQRLWFANNPSFLENASERGSLYMHYIVERLEERNMPQELALLPVIESAYNPMALSRSNAAGLWQFIPSTGRYFSLRQTNFYDGRRDIQASTVAALDYLTRLHDMFNGDWLLALAAYNAGEGTVSRAIERNEKLNLPTDYWNLPLPQETRDYVPKLLALSQVVLAPEAYGVNLNPIANEPYFEVVELNQSVDLNKVAAMADIDQDELFQLNPAFKKRMTIDGPQHLLVPTSKAQLLSANLKMKSDELLVDWQQVRKGKQEALASNDKPVRGRTYKIKAGDNLTSIAKANRVEVKDIQHWNQLSGKDLKVGRVLVMSAPGSAAPKGSTKGRINQTIAAKAPAKGADKAVASSGEGDKKSMQYKIQKGDSMYLVAKRFNVEMQHLKRWNPRTGQALKPGQTLTVYLPH
jgi:membrane-bound lytic murein transglycosylase D